MTRVVVVYHSGYGHTQRMAQAVAEGANAELIAITPEGDLPGNGWEQLKAADAIIFAARGAARVRTERRRRGKRLNFATRRAEEEPIFGKLRESAGNRGRPN